MQKKKAKKSGARKIAQKLLKMGMTVEQVVEATQLQKEEIEKINK